jgi:2-isopropylmalate synthase
MEQIIEVGPLSGRSNVLYWLQQHGVPASEELVSRIFDVAKQSSRILTDEELLAISRGSETINH